MSHKLTQSIHKFYHQLTHKLTFSQEILHIWYTVHKNALYYLQYIWALCIHNQYPNCLQAFTSKREGMIYTDERNILRSTCLHIHTQEMSIRCKKTDIEPWNKCQKGSLALWCVHGPRHLLINSSPEMNTWSLSLSKQSWKLDNNTDAPQINRLSFKGLLITT